MTRKLPAKLGSVINSLYLVCVMSFLIGIAYNHVKLISHPFPLDYNETGMLVITSVIAQGKNPFSLESQPSQMSLYPVLYNILVAPLSIVFGNTLELHRLVVGLFILACSALCFYLCRRESVPRTESMIAAALVYAGLLFYSTPIASPNSLGLFLFLSAITIPWIHGFSTRSLCVTIVLGILAFYTKQYFIACLGYVALYLFLAESKKRAIYFGFTALASFTLLLVLVCYTSPYYLENTFFAVQSSSKLATSDRHVITQLREYIQIYLPLLIILAVAIIKKWNGKVIFSLKHWQDWGGSNFIDLFDLARPLLLRKPNYIWICFACSVIIVVLVLGKNLGNHLTYFFQLISPFFLVGVFALVSRMPQWQWPFRILILFALYNSYFMLSRDFSVNEASWETVRQEIAGADDIYASTLVLQEVMDRGTPVYQNGHTRYFIFGKDIPLFFVKSEPKNSVEQIWERHVEFIQSKIKNQEFDLLLIDQWMPLPTLSQDSAVDTKELLQHYYEKTATYTLPLAKRPGGGNYRIETWKPIPTKPDPADRY